LGENKNLPNFLIVGAAKAGTTSLYEYLKLHPQIFLNDKIKESFFLTGLDFRNTNPKSGDYHLNKVYTLKEYEELFDSTRQFKSIGEVCVGYLYFYQQSIPKIKEYLSQPKIIIILRNPIERAFSNYMHFVRDGYEKLSFYEALQNEKVRNTKNYWWGYQYSKGGLYYDAVRKYLQEFENVQIIVFDDLVENTKKVYRQILEFLCVDKMFVPKNIFDKYNVSGVPRSHFVDDVLQRPQKYLSNQIWEIFKLITPKYYRRKLKRKILHSNYKQGIKDAKSIGILKEFYEEDIYKLSNLLKKDLTYWISNNV